MERIATFLSVSSGYGSGSGHGCGSGNGKGYGYGSGSGHGYGSGNGSGSGSGSGDGSGYASGSGNGYGYGSGSGSGSKTVNGDAVHSIDGVQTIVKSIKGSIAKGFILESDLTLTPTFIAKVRDCFAHGNSIESAVRDATAKAMEYMPVEERVAEFLNQFPVDATHTGESLMTGHRLLTGSCEQGCQSFVKGKGIDLTKEFSVAEFIEIVSGAYPPGEDAIRMLKTEISMG